MRERERERERERKYITREKERRAGGTNRPS